MDPFTVLSRRARDLAWPVFTAFGVELRVHVSCLLLPAAAYFPCAAHYGADEAAVWTAFWTAAVLLVTWTHEMAHVWAARSVGSRRRAVTLWPLGTLFHLEHDAPSPHAERLTAAAGPIAHAGWFVLAGVPYVFLLQDEAGAAQGPAAEALRWLLAANAVLVGVHLLPFWPLDGGRWLRAWFAVRVHATQASMQAAYVGFAGSVVLLLCGVAMAFLAEPGSVQATLGGPALAVFAVVQALACRTLLSDARWGSVPYDRVAKRTSGLPRTAWALDEPSSAAPEPPEPVVVEERRGGKEKARRVTAEVRRREATRPAARPLQERIDELLDRILEVGGVEKLSEEERRELADASERLRRGEKKTGTR